MKDNSLIVICGPTGIGKSALSVKLCKRINGAVISADSMQVYKGLDIGTAKVREDEKEGIPHFMIDVALPGEEYSAAIYKEEAKKCIDYCRKNSLVPVLCGGSGFYINAVLYDTDFLGEEFDIEYSSYLDDFLLENGKTAFHALLKECDERSFELIHENNVKRVKRALMFFHENGFPISEHNERERQEKKSPYDYSFFIMKDDRKAMYERIDRRVDKMMEEGLLSEVKGLYEKGLRQDDNSMLALSYRQLMDAIEGKCTVDEAVERIKKETRHYAKRQVTWFLRQSPKDAIIIDAELLCHDVEKEVDFVLECIMKKEGQIK